MAIASPVMLRDRWHPARPRRRRSARRRRQAGPCQRGFAVSLEAGGWPAGCGRRNVAPAWLGFFSAFGFLGSRRPRSRLLANAVLPLAQVIIQQRVGACGADQNRHGHHGGRHQSRIRHGRAMADSQGGIIPRRIYRPHDAIPAIVRKAPSLCRRSNFDPRRGANRTTRIHPAERNGRLRTNEQRSSQSP